jgi:FtsZ-binding cell division protein ZapB
MLLDSERRAIQRRQEDAASASLALAASEAEWQERYRGLLGRKKARRD